MKKIMLAACAAGALMVAPQVVSAAPILDCSADAATCNGVELGAELIDLGGGAYQIDVAFDFTGYTGSTSDVLRSVAISEFLPGGSTFSNTSFDFTGTLSDGSFVLSTNELNANGCDGGGTNSLCLEATGTVNGAVLYQNGDYTSAIFSFFFTTPDTVNADDVHIKYQYVATVGNKAGEKVGSLGSFDQDYSVCDEDNDPDCDGEPDPSVPEPTSLALVGLGLLGAGFARRRKQ